MSALNKFLRLRFKSTDKSGSPSVALEVNVVPSRAAAREKRPYFKEISITERFSVKLTDFNICPIIESKSRSLTEEEPLFCSPPFVPSDWEFNFTLS